MTDSFVLDEPAGSITVTAAALSRLVVQAAEQVDGARVRRARRGLEVRFTGGRASVTLELSARHGLVLPELAGRVQERVASAVSETCDVEVDAVDVAVVEVES